MCIHIYVYILCIYVYIKHIRKTLQCIDDVHKAPRFVWKQLLTRNQVIIQKNVTMFFSSLPLSWYEGQHILQGSENEDGDLVIKQSKHPEVSLRRLRSLRAERDPSETAVALRSLGVVGRKAGDLDHARQHLEESLQMFRSLYGDGDHSDIAETLRELGEVERQGGDFNSAKQHLEMSVRMYRACMATVVIRNSL